MKRDKGGKKSLTRRDFVKRTAVSVGAVALTGMGSKGAEAQQRRLILITKDTDFLRELRYAIGHDGILWVTQSRTELQDTVTATLSLASQYPALANMRFIVHAGGQVSRS